MRATASNDSGIVSSGCGPSIRPPWARKVTWTSSLSAALARFLHRSPAGSGGRRTGHLEEVRIVCTLVVRPVEPEDDVGAVLPELIDGEVAAVVILAHGHEG